MPNNNKINICFLLLFFFNNLLPIVFLVFYAEKNNFFDAKRFLFAFS